MVIPVLKRAQTRTGGTSNSPKTMKPAQKAVPQKAYFMLSTVYQLTSHSSDLGRREGLLVILLWIKTQNVEELDSTLPREKTEDPGCNLTWTLHWPYF